MRSVDQLIPVIVKSLRSRRASTFFVNGPPGVGKSCMLAQLREQLPDSWPRTMVLGPYAVDWVNVRKIGSYAIRDCHDAGFLNHLPPNSKEQDLAEAWQWLKENLQVGRDQTFVVLLDMVDSAVHNEVELARLFSSVRYIEGTWRAPQIRLHILLAGYWDSVRLKAHYQLTNISFPYTPSYNYCIWDGVTQEDMLAMIDSSSVSKKAAILGKLLYELTSGHPSVAMEIAGRGAIGEGSFHSLLDATRQVAEEGVTTDALLSILHRLPEDALDILARLIRQRSVKVSPVSSGVESLLTAGAIELGRAENLHYVTFRSWYMELVIRLWAKDLGIADQFIGTGVIDDIVPGTSALNIEAYQLINEMENAIRNLVTLRLHTLGVSGNHILKQRAKRFNERRMTFEDAFDRAMMWRTKSASNGITIDRNPLIAFCSTRDLASLVSEIGQESGAMSWSKLASTIERLADIRDAVMHNQLIHDDTIQQLHHIRYVIQASISEETYEGE